MLMASRVGPRARARHRRPGPAHGPGEGPAASARHDWMDAGRGLAIVLVVLLHSEEWLGTAGVNLGWWPTIDAVASDLRMPLFFTISGLLATKWVTAGWPRLLSGKVTMLVWVYLAWQ